MPTYITLSKFSADSKDAIKQNPNMALLSPKTGEETGAKILFQFATLGPYDLITIFEAPDKRTVSEVVRQIRSNGDVDSITSAAMELDQFKRAYAACYFFRTMNKNPEQPGAFSCQCKVCECLWSYTKCIK